MPAAARVSAQRLPSTPGSHSAAMDVAANGEVFWSRDYAAEAARSLAGHDLAIVGGEVYLRHPVVWATYLGGWSVEPQRGDGEPWEAWVERTLVRALAAVAEGWPGENADDLRYFFACVPHPGNSGYNAFIQGSGPERLERRRL